MQEIPYATPCVNEKLCVNEKDNLSDLPISKEIIPHQAIMINEVIVSHRYRYPEINFTKYYTICFLMFCFIPFTLIVITYIKY